MTKRSLLACGISLACVAVLIAASPAISINPPDEDGRELAWLPDATRVSWWLDDQHVRWVRYDLPGNNVLTGRVDRQGQRFGVWNFRHEPPAKSTIWAWGREVSVDEFEAIMATDPPPTTRLEE